MKTLVIIPAYNEKDNIQKVVGDLSRFQPDADYLVVNDGSSDGTRELLQSAALNHITLPVNLGIGGAVQTGYLYARDHDYDIAVQMDGDGQHDPRYLNEVIKPVQEGAANMAIGSRFLKKEGFQSSKMRQAGISILRGIIRCLCGVKILDPTSGLRACDRKLIAYFAENYAQDYPEPEAIVAAAQEGCVIQEVPVKMRERIGGVSSIHGYKAVYYMIKVSLALVVNRMMDHHKGGGQK